MRRLAPTLLIPIVLCACSRVETVYVLPPEIVLEAMEGVRFDGVYVSPRIEEIKRGEVVVEVLSLRDTLPAETHMSRSLNPESIARDFETMLSDGLWRTRIFRDVGRIHDVEPIPSPNLRLKAAITEWREGSGWLRWVVGTWIGATRVQAEAWLIDEESGHVFFAFADARTHPGLGPFSLRTFKADYLIAVDIESMIKDLTRAILKWTDSPFPPGGLNSPIVPSRPSRRPSDDSRDGARDDSGAAIE